MEENDLANNVELNKLFEWILGRSESDQVIQEVAAGTSSNLEFIWKLLLSNESLDRACNNASELHLYFIHNARLKAVRTLLPAAKGILDLGGAASPIYRMGYSHPFRKLVLIDLPLDERYIDYKDVHLEYFGEGEVTVHYCSMVDLSDFPDASFDLVWSGQSIEHITEKDAEKMCSEAYRVLSKGGYFGLDTPNRLITSIHTGRAEGMINPDHKIEYTPGELRKLLQDHKFKIVMEKGICEMPITSATKVFHYEDFILGSPISDNIEQSYISYFMCQKVK